MKCNKQYKYSNYVAFCHFHGIAVNNLGLKLFFDIGAVDILIGNGLKDEERVISIARSELGFEEDDTRKLIHYLKPFIESCGF